MYTDCSTKDELLDCALIVAPSKRVGEYTNDDLAAIALKMGYPERNGFLISEAHVLGIRPCDYGRWLRYVTRAVITQREPGQWWVEGHAGGPFASSVQAAQWAARHRQYTHYFYPWDNKITREIR
jgi:hypothetical protein